MNFHCYWHRTGSPYLVITGKAEEIAESLVLFQPHYGCKCGSTRKNGEELAFSGHAAVEFLRFKGHPIGDYSGWVPKNDSRKYWRLPDVAFIEEAARHKTLSAWKQAANGHYQHVYKKRPHLIPACTAHMESAHSPFAQGYQIYAYEFDDKSVYAGLTCNPDRRRKDHLLEGPVCKKSKSGSKFELKVLAEGLLPTAAAMLEKETIARYKAAGWIVLNRHKGGSTGSVQTKYTFEGMVNLARECGTKKAFLDKQSAAFQSAVRYGWMPRLEQAIGWPRHADHWTFEECLQSGSKHKHLIDWINADKGMYLSAWRQGWLPKIKRIVGFAPVPRPEPKWTKEACRTRAADFTSRGEWQYQCKDGSYVSARRKGWLSEIANGLYGKRKNRWSAHVVTEKPAMMLGLKT